MHTKRDARPCMHPSLAKLIDGVHAAADAGAWHAALALAISLPDICAKANGAGLHYRDWFDRYVAPEFRVPTGVFVQESDELVAITGHDAYALRNAFLHAGNDDLSTYTRRVDAFLDRIILTESHGIARAGVRKLRLPGPQQKAQFGLPVGDLCEQILRGVESWANEHASDATVQSRLDRLITIKPQHAGPDP